MTEPLRRPVFRGRFTDVRPIKGFEGGAIYAAESEGKAYVIEDESSLAWALESGTDDALRGGLRRVLEFPTVAERDAYLRERGWLPRRRPARRPPTPPAGDNR